MRVALLVLVASCQFSTSLTTDDGGVPVTVGFERAMSVEDEASGTVMVPVTLSAPAGSTVTVSYEVRDGSALRGADYDAENGTLTFAPGETMQYVAVTIVPDAAEEGDETIELALSNASGAALGTRDHTLTINSDILSRVYFTVLQTSGAESEPSVQLVVALDTAAATEVRVDYALGGTASAADYNLAAGTVVFPAGTTMRTIDLAPIDDLLDEDPEDVIVTLQNPVDVIIRPTEGVRQHTLTDNDLEPAVELTQTAAAVNENGGTVTMTVSLSAVSGRMVSVPFSAMPGTPGASAADYTYGVTTPLVIPAGTQQMTITVTIVDDTLDEFVESFATVLGMPTNATLGTNASFTISIDDNDQEPTVSFLSSESNLSVNEGNNGNPKATYKLVLSAPSGKPISVPIEFSGTAARTGLGTDYVDDAPVDFAPGATEATLTLDITPDIVPEGDETVIMSIPTNGGLTDVRQGSPSTRTHTIVNDDIL